jgi:hypothetical protein
MTLDSDVVAVDLADTLVGGYLNRRLANPPLHGWARDVVFLMTTGTDL